MPCVAQLRSDRVMLAGAIGLGRGTVNSAPGAIADCLRRRLRFLALMPHISGYLSPIGASPSLTDLAACRSLCPSRLYEEIFERETALAALQRATAAQTHKFPFG